jgi:antirestriction protein ArdC
MINLYTKVTENIVSLLENNTIPWIKPWSSTAGKNVPCNAVSNRAYSGVNTILLWTTVQAGFSLPRFLTFGQAKRLGGSVRRGETGHKIYFVKRLDTKDKDESQDIDDTKKRVITILREYTVFNVDQCQGIPDHISQGPPVKEINPHRRHDLADYFLKSTGADIREGAGEAYYAPGKDFISLPGWHQFHNSDGFYNTAFHELGHWTGHKSRLARDFETRFGKDKYAAEELVAELCSAFLCAEFAFDNATQNTSYIQHWIKLLKEDNRAIFTAASKASAAADYLRQKALQEDTETQWPSTYPPISTNSQPTLQNGRTNSF